MLKLGAKNEIQKERMVYFDDVIRAELREYYHNEFETIIKQRPDFINAKHRKKNAFLNFIHTMRALWLVLDHYDIDIQFPVLDISRDHLSFRWDKLPNGGQCQVICVTNSPRCEAEFFNAETGEKKTVKFNPNTVEIKKFCDAFIEQIKYV